MPSIFIWKANKPSTSKKTIRIYSGANWILEDYEYSSKSFKYLEQIVISGFNDSVITFHTKNMPQDWIGSELLEVTQVTYESIKSDNYGCLERVGDWMRFTLNKEIQYNKNNLEIEFNKIQNWINNKEYKKQPLTHINTHMPPQFNTLQQFNTLNLQQIQHNFQQFLINFDNNLIQNNIVIESNNPKKYNNKKRIYSNK
jgi:hypothetical protein